MKGWEKKAWKSLQGELSETRKAMLIRSTLAILGRSAVEGRLVLSWSLGHYSYKTICCTTRKFCPNNKSPNLYHNGEFVGLDLVVGLVPAGNS